MQSSNLQPPHIVVVFVLTKTMGVVMTLGQEIEYIRKLRGFSVVYMCNALNILETDYMHIISHGGPLSIYQKIMLVAATEHPFDLMSNN